MPRFIYVVYLVFMSITLVLGLNALARWRQGRPFAYRRPLIFLLILAPIGAYYAYATLTGYKAVAERRAARAERADGPIVVAVVPNSREDFWSGAQLAVEAINARGGVPVLSDDGVVVRSLDLERFEPKQFRSIAKDPSIAAVVGYMGGEDAILASAAYEESGLLFISAGSSDGTQSEHGFETLIRTMPDDVEFLRKAYSECAPGSRLAMIRSRTDRGAALAQLALSVVSNASIDKDEDTAEAEFVESVSYGADDIDILDAIAELQQLDFDSVVVVDVPPRAADVIRHLRRLGVSQPAMLAHDLDDPAIFARSEGGDICFGVVDTSAIPDDGLWQSVGEEERTLAFYQAFEAVVLLAEAWQVAETTDAFTTSATLRAVKPWRGLMGSYDFDSSGRIHGKPVTIKVAKLENPSER